MRALFSPTQALHAEKTKRLFLSPEAKALRTDPDLGEIQEIALLDHLFKGWRNLTDRGVDGRSGKAHTTYGLAVDDKVELNKAELLGAQIAEVKNALANNVEVPEAFRQLAPEDREYIGNLIDKHIFASHVGEIGGRGAEGRVYPLDYAVAELRGQPIPANFAPGQKQSRGKKLMLDIAEGVDVDTGVGLYGVDIDAMHRVPAAEAPELVAAESNIKMGPTSMNQSDGRRTGQQLAGSRQSRLLKLQDALFLEEHGVPNKWRGGLDKQTRDDLAINRKMTDKDRQQEYAQRLLDQRIDELRPLVGKK